ncbi:2-C-methyl-D-erythritol 4-phosphate cytidylyltransferase [Schaalia sp. ZJ405]|uniref:IspD/TarI family cytidylyltransferase n=1 Tax=Schaalia sp. ZJ405 TaxID=2709403 RepID=UPI0013ED1E89|nr:IspD/TarI family cytidylyltransferase [Schaalia sp. ZJ405]QPK80729.1 2-C-methyl-D-erythritol 4-phosphate cytidylyltransferase [Schaalia sp. ZJ405]
MNVALIFAGGIGARMRAGAVPKQFLEIYGRPVIVHTLEQFQQHPEIDAILVVILEEYRQEFLRLLDRYELSKVKWVVSGGSTGQESRHNGLKALREACPKDSVVLIHDGVRPLVDEELITANIRSVEAHGTGVTCTKTNETIVVANEPQVTDVIPRDRLWTAQAPQSFVLGEVADIYDRAVSEGITDSIDTCSLYRRYGIPVRMVPGPHTNIKITTSSDYYIARTFFTLVEDAKAFGARAEME